MHNGHGKMPVAQFIPTFFQSQRGRKNVRTPELKLRPIVYPESLLPEVVNEIPNEPNQHLESNHCPWGALQEELS